MSTEEGGGTGSGAGPAEKRPRTAAEAFGLSRTLNWWDGFSIALGVPVLLIFSVGSIVATNGTLAPFIWIASVLIGFLQAFVFAEMAGLFPLKSGGHSLYGSEAWRRRNRFIPPMNVWGNWFAWSPVLSIGALLIGGYVQAQWIPNADFEWHFGPFHISLATFIGAAALLSIFWLNHFSIKSSARIQQVLGAISIVPLVLLIIVPLIQGKVHGANLTPIQPLDGNWGSWGTFEAIAGGLFVAAWSAYAFETTIAYTSEYRNPGKDAPRAILAAGGLNLIFYVLGPIVLLGVVGQERIAEDPSVAFQPLASDVFGAGSGFVIALLIVSQIVIINTAILGSARTLFQASLEGYTFSGLAKVSKRKVPARAMGFDVGVNLLLICLGTPISILAASTVGYMLTNVFDLTAGNMLRRDTKGIKAAYRAPSAFMKLSILFAAINMTLLFVGGPSWGWGAVALGWGIVLLAIPFFFYRKWKDRQQGVEEEEGLVGADIAVAEALGDVEVGGEPDAIVQFAKEVEEALDAPTPHSSFWPMVGTWIVAGILLTLGVAFNGGIVTVFYIAGLAMVVVAFVGFLVPRGRGGWYGL